MVEIKLVPIISPVEVIVPAENFPLPVNDATLISPPYHLKEKAESLTGTLDHIVAGLIPIA
jgi:hypothetical protein